MKIRWTEGACDNLDDIEKYIGNNNPVAAIKTVLKIINSVNQLARHPSIGRPGRVEGTKELIITGSPYIVPYRVKDETVEVLRVFHHGRKWPNEL